MVGKTRAQETLGQRDDDVGVAGTQVIAEDKGLADVTDLKNEDFIYVY